MPFDTLILLIRWNACLSKRIWTKLKENHPLGSVLEYIFDIFFLQIHIILIL